jgi:hypothetical protein
LYIQIPAGKFDVFLSKLEFIIQELSNKNRILILSGDWNINFLQDGLHVREINNALIRYNLISTVKDPTRITKTSSYLLDVIIIHEEKLIEPARVIELGMSDHDTQILSVLIKTHITRSYKVFERRKMKKTCRNFSLITTGVMARCL